MLDGADPLGACATKARAVSRPAGSPRRRELAELQLVRRCIWAFMARARRLSSSACKAWLGLRKLTKAGYAIQPRLQARVFLRKLIARMQKDAEAAVQSHQCSQCQQAGQVGVNVDSGRHLILQILVQEAKDGGAGQVQSPSRARNSAVVKAFTTGHGGQMKSAALWTCQERERA